MASFPRAALFFLVLLVAFLCSFAITLDVDERQKEKEAFESVDKVVSRGAADEAPQPPQNLVVFPQSDTSIMLTWSAPSDPTDFDHYLVYVEDEDMETTTDYTYYIFNNLEPCTDYTFGVMSVSAAGDTSDPLLGEGQTEAGAPPAPQNLQVDGYTSTTVTLSWDKPDTRCDIVEYRVRWSTDGTDTQSTPTSETSFTVTELSKNTTYVFTVFASTSYGEGPEGATVQQTTDAVVGGPPENLVAVGVSSSAINVSWSPPADEPDYYWVSAFPCMTMEDSVLGLSYLITDLDPCETCEISVTSHYDDTQKYTAYVRGTTDAEDPPPPESCSVEVEGDGLTVTWNKPFSRCDLGNSRVQWTRTKLWGDGGKESGNGTTSGTRYNVPGAVPYSQYTFEISSSIDGVFGSSASCSGTSSETQSSPPTTLKQTANNISSVTITWGLPQYIRGELEGWYLRWTTLDGEPIGEDTVSEVQWTYTISELSKSSTYVVYVSAVNGAGNGEEGERDVHTAQVTMQNSPNTGLIIGLSAAGGILLTLLLVGSIILCRRRGSLKPPRSAPHMPEVVDADNDELYKMQHLSSATQGLHDNHRSVDNATDRELYVSWPSFHIYETINEDGQMPDSPTGRQVSITLPKEEGFNRSSEQVNIKLKIFEEDNIRPSQQDLHDRPSFSGGREKPSLLESGRDSSQQIGIGRSNLKENGRRPPQLVDLGQTDKN